MEVPKERPTDEEAAREVAETMYPSYLCGLIEDPKPPYSMWVKMMLEKVVKETGDGKIPEGFEDYPNVIEKLPEVRVKAMRILSAIYVLETINRLLKDPKPPFPEWIKPSIEKSLQEIEDGKIPEEFMDKPDCMDNLPLAKIQAQRLLDAILEHEAKEEQESEEEKGLGEEQES